MNTRFQYTSVHQYLDAVLKNNPNASVQEVKEAKAQYWKQYYAHYRRKRRKLRKEFTLSFDKKQLELIHQKRMQLSVSEFLYSCVFEALSTSNVSIVNADMLSPLHQKLMELISLLEESLDNESKYDFESLLIRIEQLEEQFLKLFNKK